MLQDVEESDDGAESLKNKLPLFLHYPHSTFPIQPSEAVVITNLSHCPLETFCVSQLYFMHFFFFLGPGGLAGVV